MSGWPKLDRRGFPPRDEAEAIVRWANRVGARVVVQHGVGRAVCWARWTTQGVRRGCTKEARFQWGYALNLSRAEPPPTDAKNKERHP